MQWLSWKSPPPSFSFIGHPQECLGLTLASVGAQGIIGGAGPRTMVNQMQGKCFIHCVMSSALNALSDNPSQ